MKFIHTADWHLGKLVHGVYMTEQQKVVLKQFIDLVAEEKPNAVIIAGDLYDRSVPPTEAISLLEETLFKINVELQTPILAISGNHDSAERLSFGSSWYQKSHLYIRGKVQDCMKPVHINGVNFYLLPFSEPGIVREWFDDSTIYTHDDAMKRIVAEIEKQMNPNEPNVLVGHAFVLGGETTDSERIFSVGGAGHVSSQHFRPFTYTALGHLHNPNAFNDETIRYSGSLLKYSFSEVNHNKSVSIITIEENGTIQREERKLIPDLDMREITGYLDELLDPSYYQSQKQDDFLKVTLLDEGALIDPMNKLRNVYPNILHLERKIDAIDLKNKTIFEMKELTHKSELELFTDFYQEMTTLEFSSDKKDWIEQVIDEARKEFSYK